MTYDKLLFLLAMRGQGLTVPAVQAIFYPDRYYADAARLSNANAVARWLREDAAYLFFSKLVESTGSAGIASIEAYDAVTDELVSADERRVSVDHFSREVGRYRERGYLFQERIATHPEIAPICGRGVSACLMLVRIDDGKPILHRATWKIPAGANMADNFWRDGNMLGALDPETGEVTRVVRGIAMEAIEVDIHPDTRKALKGYRLPDWEALKEICLKAAATFPPLWLQGWDVALSDRDPVLLEVEGNGGGAQMIQHAQGRGLLDDDFVAFLERWKRRQVIAASTSREAARNVEAAVA